MTDEIRGSRKVGDVYIHDFNNDGKSDERSVKIRCENDGNIHATTAKITTAINHDGKMVEVDQADYCPFQSNKKMWSGGISERWNKPLTKFYTKDGVKHFSVGDKVNHNGHTKEIMAFRLMVDYDKPDITHVVARFSDCDWAELEDLQLVSTEITAPSLTVIVGLIKCAGADEGECHYTKRDATYYEKQIAKTFELGLTIYKDKIDLEDRAGAYEELRDFIYEQMSSDPFCKDLITKLRNENELERLLTDTLIRLLGKE